MIDYEEVVEAIWRYDCPRIDIDEDITTLYADGKCYYENLSGKGCGDKKCSKERMIFSLS